MQYYYYYYFNIISYLKTGSAQTVLTLPVNLPSHIEELLKPYFSYTLDQQKTETDPNASLYQKLFEFDENAPDSIQSSPALSTGLSPIQFSPEFRRNSPNHKFESSFEMPELRDCTLSPIGRSPKESRSACRLSFSAHMSVDTTALMVPDVDKMPNNDSCSFHNIQENNTLNSMNEFMGRSDVNWDMEFKEVSILSHTPSSNNSPEIATPDTPHSGIFTSQRKKLSDSFRDEVDDIEMDDRGENVLRTKRPKNRLFESTDAGYHTAGGTSYENSVCDSTHMFASTPTKNHK